MIDFNSCKNYFKPKRVVSFRFYNATTLSKIDNGYVKVDGFESAKRNFSLKMV